MLMLIVEGTTENISRDGILMRWHEGVLLPDVGSGLTVEFTLPESEGFGQRLLRCRTTVVRIDESEDGRKSVAMRIDGINFISADEYGVGAVNLESIPAATERIN